MPSILKRKDDEEQQKILKPAASSTGTTSTTNSGLPASSNFDYYRWQRQRNYAQSHPPIRTSNQAGNKGEMFQQAQQFMNMTDAAYIRGDWDPKSYLTAYNNIQNALRNSTHYNGQPRYQAISKVLEKQRDRLMPDLAQAKNLQKNLGANNPNEDKSHKINPVVYQTAMNQSLLTVPKNAQYGNRYTPFESVINEKPQRETAARTAARYIGYGGNLDNLSYGDLKRYAAEAKYYDSKQPKGPQAGDAIDQNIAQSRMQTGMNDNPVIDNQKWLSQVAGLNDQQQNEYNSLTDRTAKYDYLADHTRLSEQEIDDYLDGKAGGVQQHEDTTQQANSLLDQNLFSNSYTQLQNELKNRDFQRKYAGYYLNDDFVKNSKYYVGSDSYYPDYRDDAARSKMSEEDLEGLFIASVNGSQAAYDFLHSRIDTEGNKVEYSNQFDKYGTNLEKYMQPDEVSMFNYLLNTQGKDAAFEYFDGLAGSELCKRKTAVVNQEYADWATEEPFMANFVTSITKPFAVPAQAISMLYDLASNGGTINGNDPKYAYFGAANTVRNTTRQNIIDSTGSDFVGDLYMGGMSALDNLIDLGLGMKIGSMFGLTGQAAQKAISATTLGIMSTDAMETATINNLRNGQSTEDALINGVASGTIEFITEKIGLERLFNSTLLGKGAWIDWVKNMVAEGGEEGLADAFNWAWGAAYDQLTGHTTSEWKRAVNQYILENGLAPADEDKAFSAIFAQNMGQLGTDILIGGLAALPMGGMYSGQQFINNQNYKSSIQPYVNKNMMDISGIMSSPESVQQMVDEGLSYGKGTKVYNTAAQLRASIEKGNVTEEQVQELYHDLVEQDVIRSEQNDANLALAGSRQSNPSMNDLQGGWFQSDKYNGTITEEQANEAFRDLTESDAIRNEQRQASSVLNPSQQTQDVATTPSEIRMPESSPWFSNRGNQATDIAFGEERPHAFPMDGTSVGIDTTVDNRQRESEAGWFVGRMSDNYLENGAENMAEAMDKFYHAGIDPITYTQEMGSIYNAVMNGEDIPETPNLNEPQRKAAQIAAEADKGKNQNTFPMDQQEQTEQQAEEPQNRPQTAFEMQTDESSQTAENTEIEPNNNDTVDNTVHEYTPVEKTDDQIYEDMNRVFDFAEKQDNTQTDVYNVIMENYHDDMNVDAYMDGMEAIQEQAQNGVALEDITVPKTAAQYISDAAKNMMYTAVTGQEVNANVTEQGNISVPGRSQWNDGQSAGIQGRGMAETSGRIEGAGRDSGILPQETGRGNEGFTYSEKVETAQSLRLPSGTTTNGVRVITGGFTTEMQNITQRYQERGLTPHFFTGNDLSFRDTSARAAVTGTDVWIRADDPKYTVRQIAGHEEFHVDIAAADPAVKRERINTAVNALQEHYGQRYIDVVREGYAQLYEATGLDQDAVLEEMLCDIAGQMNELKNAYNDLPALREFYDSFVEKGSDIVKKTVGRNSGNVEGVKNSAVISQDQDQRYMELAQDPEANREELQRMVDQAANEAGYTIRAYHGTPWGGFNIFNTDRVHAGRTFGNGIYLTSSPSVAEGFTYPNARDYDRIKSGETTTPKVYDTYIKIGDDALVFDWDNFTYNGKKVKGFNGKLNMIQMDVEANPDKNVVINNIADGGEEKSTVYVIKDSNSIKSADPVVYDNNGNIIPLSERFNTENPDIRYSRENSKKVSIADKTMEDVAATLREQVNSIKPNNNRPQITEAAAKKLVNTWIRNYSSTVNANDFVKDVQKLITRLGSSYQNKFESVNEAVYGIAQKLVKNAKAVVDWDGSEIMKDIRTTKIKVSPRTTADIADWNEFRKAHFGKMMISTAAGMDVTEFYNDMAQKYGESTFPAENNNATDQLLFIADFVDNYTPITDNPFSYDMAEAIQGAALDIYNDLINLDVLRSAGDVLYDEAKQNKRIETLKAENRQRMNDLRKKARESRDAQIQKLKDHNREVRENRKARKEDRDARKMLLKVAQRLDRIKTTAANRELINDLIGDLDLVAITLTDGKAASLKELAAWYESEKVNRPDFVTRDDIIGNQIARLSQKHISELTLDEVRELTDALKALETTIRTEKQLIGVEDSRDTFQMGMEIIKNIDNAPGTRKGLWRNIDSVMVQGTLSPVRFTHRLTGYVESDPLYRAVAGEDGLAGGQRKMLDYQMRAGNLFTEWLTDKQFMKNLTGTKAEMLEYTVMTADGQTKKIQLTPAMRMTLYLASKDQGWMEHMCGRDTQNGHVAGGGITLPDMVSYRKGNISDAYGSNTTKVKVTKSFLDKLASDMTTKERKFADAIHDYFNGMSKDALNAVSEQLLGYSIAQVGDYLPISVDKNFLGAEYGALKYDGTIEGMGNLKARQSSKKPVIVRDITDILKQSIESTSKYVGLAIPIRNINKLMGVNFGHVDENGQYQNFEGSVLESISNKWGEKAQKYIEKMISDLQTPNNNQEDLDKLFAKIRSKYAGAVLTLNLSVAMKQAASYPTAAGILGWSPLIKAFSDNGHVDLDLIAKYTPLQWYRTKGFSTAELGDIQNQNNFFANLPKGLNWIQGVDLLTTRKLWKASEFYVRDNQPELYKKGAGAKGQSDAYYRAVADIYNQVIEETQPNYTSLQRPEYLRSRSGIVQTLMMFKTQPMQNFNVLYDAIGNFKAKKVQLTNNPNSTEAQTQYKESKTKLSRAITSQIGQLITFAAMTMAWNLFRRKKEKYTDEEGNFSLNTMMQSMGKDIGSGLFGMLPFGSDIWSALSSLAFGDTYYGFESVTDSALGDLGDAIMTAWKLGGEMIGSIASGEPFDLTAQKKKIKSVFSAVSKIFGIPADNLWNMGTALYKRGRDIFDDPHMADYYAMAWDEDPSTKKTQFVDVLYAAFKDENSDAYEDLRQAMIDSKEFATESAIGKYLENNPDSTRDEAIAAASADYLDDQIEKRQKGETANGLTFADQAKYDELAANLQSSDKFKSASESDQAALMQLAMDYINKNNQAWNSGRAGVEAGEMTETEYLEFMLELQKADQANNNNGSYDKDEQLAAIKAMGWSDAKAKKLWQYLPNTSKNPYEAEATKTTPKQTKTTPTTTKTVPKKTVPEKQEKEEKKEIEKGGLSSSWLSSYEYNPNTGQLNVYTKSGGGYTHYVPQEIFDAFMASSSKGSYYNSVLKYY